MPNFKRPPELGEIQETLLIPLYGRAVETRKRRGLLNDPRAVEMVDSIDYDFSRFDGAKSLIGATLRTLQFDADGLSGAELALETANGHAVDRQDRHDVLGKMAARMHWRCDDPRLVEHWRPDVRLADTRTFADLMPSVRSEVPLPVRLLLRAMTVLRRRDIESYRLNLFKLGAEGAATS